MQKTVAANDDEDEDDVDVDDYANDDADDDADDVDDDYADDDAHDDDVDDDVDDDEGGGEGQLRRKSNNPNLKGGEQPNKLNIIQKQFNMLNIALSFRELLNLLGPFLASTDHLFTY